jgi:spermidine synthase
MSERLYVLELDGMEQSAVDLNDPTNLVFDYMRRIADLIDALTPAPPAPIRALHVGGAAMSLPRYVAATRPASKQIVLEPNELVIAQVRVQAPVPRRSGIKVRPVDGATGIRAVGDDSQDLVILDAFENAAVPEELTTADFIQEVRRVVAPAGVFVANLVDQPPFARVRSFLNVARVLGSPVVGVEPATVKGRRAGNVLVACGAVSSRAFGSPSPMHYRIIGGQEIRDRFGA